MPNSETEIKIGGMTCSHCQRAVEQAITNVKGVERVDVDLSLGKATVIGSAEEAALIAAVEDEGYTAKVVSSHEHHG